jgi:signal transduction histidine kinase
MYQTILQYKEIEFVDAIPAEHMIYADADLLGCVIRNLLSNAIKYTPAGGSIGVFCRVVDGVIEVEVRDSGTGIVYKDVENVFSDAIVSRDGLLQEKGSGIGLKLCKEFVELNGGRIWAQSFPGVGSSFFFSVPAVGAAGESAILKDRNKVSEGVFEPGD